MNHPATPKRALVTGVTGQDGAYLARFLLEQGYEVHGLKRRSSSFNTARIEDIYQDPHEEHQRFVLHYGDLTDSTNLIRIVQEVQPNEIYNLAAQSHVAVSFETREYTVHADSIGALRPGDNYDLAGTHVLPALIRKTHEAKQTGEASIEIWGTGRPRREFLHVDDLADGCVFLLRNYSGEEHVNVGSGKDITIAELAELVCEVVGFEGTITKDTSKPDGTPRKLMSGDKIAAMGWTPNIGLREGIRHAYAELLAGNVKQPA